MNEPNEQRMEREDFFEVFIYKFIFKLLRITYCPAKILTFKVRLKGSPNVMGWPRFFLVLSSRLSNLTYLSASTVLKLFKDRKSFTPSRATCKTYWKDVNISYVKKWAFRVCQHCWRGHTGHRSEDMACCPRSLPQVPEPLSFWHPPTLLLLQTHHRAPVRWNLRLMRRS